MPVPAEIPRLVSHPREVYLRQNEGRIRSAASGLLARGLPDPEISAALNAVHFAEDLYEIHNDTAPKFQQRGKPHLVQIHEDHAARAMQLKFRALDQLAHLVL